MLAASGARLLSQQRIGDQIGRERWQPLRHQRPGRQRRQSAAAAASGEGGGAEPSSDSLPQLGKEQEERLRVQYERGHCYGCGVRLQTQEPEVPGFVERERYEVKRRHRQLGQLLCRRCQELSNGAMIPAVADFAQREAAGAGQQAAQQGARRPAAAVAAAAAQLHAETAMRQPGQAAEGGGQQRHTGFTDKVLLTPEELREKLKVVQQQKALVVLLVDLLDASGSLLGRVRDLVGNNPIVLVGTKADLLPPGTDFPAVAEWLKEFAAFKRVNSVSVHLVSAKSGAGVPAAVAAIRRERRGRDVFVMGAANVGKSAFIRSLVKDMSRSTSRQFDPMASSRGRFLPVESAMPGTTLELIPMEVFAAGGMLYDTPGLHLHHRVPHLLTPAENKQLHPRRKLRAYVPPSPSELLEVTTAFCNVPVGVARAGGAGAAAAAGGRVQGRTCPVAAYFWGGLVKIQVLACPPDTELVFYGPQALLVEASVEDAEATAGSPGGGFLSSASSASDSEGGEGGPSSSWAPPSDGSESDGGASSSGECPSVRAAAAAGATIEAAGRESEVDEPHGFGAASVMRRGGLRPAKDVTIQTRGPGRRALADVAISGIPGWVAVHASGSKADSVQLRVWTPPGVEVFSRPPLPAPCPLTETDLSWLPAGLDPAALPQQRSRRGSEGAAQRPADEWR